MRPHPRALGVRSLCVALVAALALPPRTANAAVVFESYVGPRPENASAVLAPLLAELEAQGIAARPETVRARVRVGAGRPGIANPALTMAGLVERIDKATELLQRRSYGAAAQRFESALSDAQANFALLVASPEASHTAMMDAWIGLATSRARLGDHAGADQAMQEAVRSFPSQETAIRKGYGAEPAARYRKAARRLQTRGAGKLIVTANDPAALIFVNEDARPQNAILETDALPGSHRVLVQLPGTSGWRYDVTIEPNQKTQLDIDVRFHAAVVISDAWVGFSFPSTEKARHSVVPYAGRLLASSEDKGVIVVTLTTWNARPAVMASVYRIDTGVHLRSHVVPLDGRNDGARLQALAGALASRDAATLLAGRHSITAIDDPFAPLPMPRSEPREPGRAKWFLLGAAVLAAGAGAALVYVDDRDGCGPDCPPLRRAGPYGYASLAVAGVMAAATGYLFHRDACTCPHSSREHTTVGIAPTSSGLLLTAAGRF